MNAFKKGLRREWGKGRKKTPQTVDLSQDGCVWRRSIRMRMAILVPALLRCPGVCVRAYGGENTAGGINFSVIGWGWISNLGWRRGAGPPLGETRSRRPPGWGQADPTRWVLGSFWRWVCWGREESPVVSCGPPRGRGRGRPAPTAPPRPSSGRGRGRPEPAVI